MVFWKSVKSNPNEYLIVGHHGKITNHGTGASAFLTRGASYVIIPSTKQETKFVMTQESKDGIPLRFKGVVMYRVIDPVAVAKLFDFTQGGDGHNEIKTMLSDVCLGELRAVVSKMTMEQCIEERKTTLTNAIVSELKQVTRGMGTDGDSRQHGWGIEVDVVQVAQVFIVDEDLRRQIEAEVRNEIKTKSDLSDVRMEEETKLARMSSARKVEQESLETERQNADITREKVRLQQDLRHEELEAEAPIRLLQIEQQREVLTQELETHRLKLELRQIATAMKKLETEGEMFREKAQQALRKDLLPIEQIPAIAESLSRMFQGVNMSIYGEDSRVLAAVAPILDLLGNTLREAGLFNVSGPDEHASPK